MTKSATNAVKTDIPKPVAAPKRTTAPFADKIPFIRSLIIDSVKPEVNKKIYLFGSYAYGKPTKSSDIDLCVVINNRFDRLKASVKIQRGLSDKNIFPLDLLVYKENQFYDITNPRGVENTILTKGKVLYG
ncbi:MAG: nucleotidyltransferase domain-containing protein [Chitinispirillales bacterium]|jgi:predicted nucleotidyltransferase|nr:nucleotidyltransferase domain-containing protein [Chitinispirillales bacterium]